MRFVVGVFVVVALWAALPSPTVITDLAKPLRLLGDELRIDESYATPNVLRLYQVLDRRHGMKPSAMWFSQPVGIVFHTTESGQVPARSLLSSVRERRSYNFVVTRHGDVFRIVDELDAANHSGNSIWANGDSVYLNLNSSFLAVAFEAQTPEGGVVDLTPAQLHAGWLLTRRLRDRYRIPAENCVTHAQVSVNPDNLRIGYHTDGANRFPFDELGLPDNYRLPPVSLTDFGFEYDETFLRSMGGAPWSGLIEAEQRSAITRSEMRARYRRLYSALRLTGAMDEPR